FFSIAYMSVAYDFAIEVTYPEPESFTSGIIALTYQFLSWLMTVGIGEMLRSVGAEWSNNTLSFLLLIGILLHIIIKPNLKRQAVGVTDTAIGNGA
ncbi:hypothetical protein L9F63_004274, partial [Diploptera punctata]